MELLASSNAAVGLLFCLGALSVTEGGKLLVVPMDGSHWLSMSSVVERLAQNGHEIIVVKPESSIVKFDSNLYTLRNFSTPYSNQDIHERLQQLVGSQFTASSLIEMVLNSYNSIMGVQHMINSMCESLLHNKQFIRNLQEEKFDAVLNDPMFFCGVILAEHLGIPSVHFLRGIPCMYDYISAQCDSPLSYVPRHFTQNSDKMNFLQRVGNTLLSLAEPILCGAAFRGWEHLASEFLQREVTAIQLLSRTSVWLMRVDFVFDHPRPVMPNMVYIGGINCAGTKPLSQEFEKLVNSSGEHGFVVFSLGSMVSEIPMNKAMDIAEALKSIPQKVFWRYTGKAPPNLGENTHLVKWLPQNDLLAHPKARAFITHAGSHGIYEGICNAVPMVMMPLFGDQMDNAKRIESRGAGLTLNVLHMTPEDLSNAVRAVINNPVYKENIQRMSSLHLDRPIHPLDLAVHWVEFVMRHKGAPHLRPAAHDLNWFQYYSLDVIGFLLAVLLTALFISLKCCTFVFRRCFKRNSKKQRKSKSQ
uniref:UDP-glucuronosyltransferase n=1 Tax=Xenopus tropicalis TaxID=8364 RepID=A0A6I8Q0R7_XENTR|eukprot:XP_012826321.1 PREDICTED: UDP-glucuronosyltransferase 1-1-like isoform X2 [Xenopus tropicalis]